MTHNLFDNSKFGDMFLTTEKKQAVFLRFSENAEYEFANLYVEDWGYVQVFRHNGKEVLNDAAHSIISKKEEPISKELEEAADNALNKVLNTHEIVNIRSCMEMFKYGAQWKEKEMQSTIELAEDHAMLAGMEKMKEQMMAEAIDAVVHIDAGNYPYIPEIELYDYDNDEPLAKNGDKYKVVLIKEE